MIPANRAVYCNQSRRWLSALRLRLCKVMVMSQVQCAVVSVQTRITPHSIPSEQHRRNGPDDRQRLLAARIYRFAAGPLNDGQRLVGRLSQANRLRRIGSVGCLLCLRTRGRGLTDASGAPAQCCTQHAFLSIAKHARQIVGNRTGGREALNVVAFAFVVGRRDLD